MQLPCIEKEAPKYIIYFKLLKMVSNLVYTSTNKAFYNF